jgi:hypothetical protein
MEAKINYIQRKLQLHDEDVERAFDKIGDTASPSPPPPPPLSTHSTRSSLGLDDDMPLIPSALPVLGHA